MKIQLNSSYFPSRIDVRIHRRALVNSEKADPTAVLDKQIFRLCDKIPLPSQDQNTELVLAMVPFHGPLRWRF
jgi:plastocyanin domain-containing protein